MYSILEKDYQTLQKSIGAEERINFIHGKGCRTVFLIMTFLFITYSGSAASYYVSNSGNDSNTGTAPETAWQTISKVNKYKFDKDDVILFNRGDEWREQLTVPRSNLTFDAYGIGAKPIINGADVGYTWTPVNNNIWSIPYTQNNAVVRVNGTLNSAVINKAALTNNTYYINTTAESISIYSTADPNTLMVEVSAHSTAIYCSKNNTTLKNLEVTGAFYAGIELYGEVNGSKIIRNNVLDNITTYQNNIGIQCLYGSKKTTIKNCIASFNLDGGICLFEHCDSSLITNNYVHDNGMSWFRGDNDGIPVYKSSFVTVSNNIVDHNKGNGIAFALDKTDSSAVITGNVISDNAWSKQLGEFGIMFNGSLGSSVISHNISYGNSILGMEASGEWAIANTNVSILNNTIYADNPTGRTGGLILSGTNTILLKNNIIVSNGSTGSLISVYNGSTTFNSDYNLFYCNTEIKFRRGSNAYSNLSDWQSLENDAHSANTDPMFTDSPNRNFTLQSGSPAINAGTNVGLTQDILGNPIVGNPDIGAYEYGSTIASSFTITGPSSGTVNSSSTDFMVTPNHPYTGTITITPSGTGSAGLSPIVLTFSTSSIAQTYAFTPTVAGSITLTATNNGSLSNPVRLTYTVNAVVPGTPTSVVATAGNTTASVTFMAPVTDGCSAITGYTVTSIPAGGIDTNVGSTALTHILTGLANDVSYTFTVTTTNSVGNSIASVASNPVIPVVANVTIKQGEIIPSHFTYVWQGSNGSNPMNIKVVSAVLEDIPLSVDDEIAVFSGSACVGASKLTQSIVPTDSTTFLTILASQNDGSVNGFIDKDTIVFKIWNIKTQNELQVNAVIYRNDVSTWKTNGRYSPGATTVVEIESYPIYTQRIELLKGYNLISTYVSAQNSSVSDVTKTLVDQGNLIDVQDETGNSFENWGAFGGWINQLGSLKETEGYKIQVANNCTTQVTGRSIAMPFDISLKTGWNIISFPRTDVVNAMNVVQTLIDQNILVKVQDEAGNSIENWGLYGGWKNEIGNFIPGKAYKVKMSADVVLTFQENYPKLALVTAKPEQTEFYHSSVEGNGTDHMNINITELNTIGLSAGDELAAFDGAVCVASTKITDANLLCGSACLAASFSTDIQKPNGFNVGDPIQIRTWNKLSGNESKVNAEVITGQMNYEKNASVLIKMKSASLATGLSNLNDVVKIDVFPNPCRGKFTVRLSENPKQGTRIDVLDVSGHTVASRLITEPSEIFNLDNQPSGLYLVKTTIGSIQKNYKLIIN